MIFALACLNSDKTTCYPQIQRTNMTWMHAALLSFYALVYIPFDPHFVLQTKQYKYIKYICADRNRKWDKFFFFNFFFFWGWVQMVIFLKRVCLFIDSHVRKFFCTPAAQLERTSFFYYVLLAWIKNSLTT